MALIRGWAYASLNTYIPFFVSPDRPDPGFAGSMLAVYLGFHAAGAFSGGVLADRLGRAANDWLFVAAVDPVCNVVRLSAGRRVVIRDGRRGLAR